MQTKKQKQMYINKAPLVRLALACVSSDDRELQ